MTKQQKDITCGNNNDENTVKKEHTDKDAPKAVETAIDAALTAADAERVAFRAFHCPPTKALPKATCTNKESLSTEEKEDIKRSWTLTYYPATKKYTAKAEATWTASFDCNEPKKR
jgi:hypothetical protein